MVSTIRIQKNLLISGYKGFSISEEPSGSLQFVVWDSSVKYLLVHADETRIL